MTVRPSSPPMDFTRCVPHEGQYYAGLESHPDVRSLKALPGRIFTASSPLGHSYVQEIRHPDVRHNVTKK